MNFASNKLSDVYGFYLERLKEIYPVDEAKSLMQILLSEYAATSRVDLQLYPGNRLNESVLVKLHKACLKLEQKQPVQYILGHTDFYDCKIQVDENVLIPRPETEELVDWIVKDHKQEEGLLSVLDFGTGSGCIPIALKKHKPNFEAFAVEIDPKAIQLAKQNAFNNQVSVCFIEADILAPDILTRIPKDLDVIVSNPPYVRECEKPLMDENVLGFEPSLALFVSDAQPLVFYRAIAKLAFLRLKKSGCLYFEINEYLHEEVRGLVQNIGFSKVEIRKDLQGKYRMLKACL
jgi:release factor glutamine methyltransferase